MNDTKLRFCLDLLQAVDTILMADGEIALGAHLSLVIELLSERLPGD